MVRKAEKRDIGAIIRLLHQVNMVHYEKRPDLFKPYTTKYDEQELEALLGDDSKPIFVPRPCISTTSVSRKLPVGGTSVSHCMSMSVIMPVL